MKVSERDDAAVAETQKGAEGAVAAGAVEGTELPKEEPEGVSPATPASQKQKKPQPTAWADMTDDEDDELEGPGIDGPAQVVPVPYDPLPTAKHRARESREPQRDSFRPGGRDGGSSRRPWGRDMPRDNGIHFGDRDRGDRDRGDRDRGDRDRGDRDRGDRDRGDRDRGDRDRGDRDRGMRNSRHGGRSDSRFDGPPSLGSGGRGRRSGGGSHYGEASSWKGHSNDGPLGRSNFQFSKYPTNESHGFLSRESEEGFAGPSAGGHQVTPVPRAAATGTKVKISISDLCKTTTADTTATRNASIFGEGRPRNEVTEVEKRPAITVISRNEGAKEEHPEPVAAGSAGAAPADGKK